MALMVRDFPVCCTMKILTGFGGTRVAGRHTHGVNMSRAEMDADLGRIITEQRDRGMAVLSATTNDEQTDANAALRAAGFAHSRWASKGNHPETRVRLWYKRLNVEE